MASGHMNRVKRPDTWLHRPMLRNVKKVLANPEPSTHDPGCVSTSSTRTGHAQGRISDRCIRPAAPSTSIRPCDGMLCLSHLRSAGVLGEAA
jgi:hypothetical protein